MGSEAKRVRERERGQVLLCTSLFVYFFSKAYSTHLVFYHLRSWNSPPNETAGVYSWELLLVRGGGEGGCAARFSTDSDPISELKCHFPHPFLDPEVVLKRNITSWHKTEIMSSLQQKYVLKSISSSHITLSFLFIWKCLTTNTLIHNRSSLVLHTKRKWSTQFQTKMGKIYTRF